jgi:hypothetical protein
MNTPKTIVIALALAFSTSASAAPETDGTKLERERSAKSAQAGAQAATAVSSEVDEEWGIWNQAPRQGNRDPLLALGYADRAPGPEPIDAAARGERLPTDGTAGRDPIQLNAVEFDQIPAPPPPNPADGT